ncbi:sensor histidine kinase [Clostridium hydrogenum]|uniref:sensor histidine kinase n=1 Tax=Clostridium hydrogenum TaxID=2855764 RepID=UPI002E341A31|nr:GHKL domain-containing protein [Clostridium hydrogenum]
MNDILWFISTSIENTAFMLLYKKISNKNEDKKIIRDLIFVLLTVIEASTYNILNVYFNTLVDDFVKTLLFFIFAIIFIRLIYKDSIINAFVYYVLSETTLLFIELATHILMNLSKLIMNFTNMYVFNLMGALATVILVCGFCKLFPMDIFSRYKGILNQVKFIFVNLIIYSVVVKFLLVYKPKLINKHYFIIIFASILYSIINVMSIIYNCRIIDQKAKLETYDKYIPITIQLMEDVKRRQHDFKNHINTIYGIAQTCDKESLKDELENYMISLNNSFKSMDEIIRIDNGVVAAIIYLKSSFAKQNKIKFIYNIEGSLKGFPLENYEISEVLNNLIDNALEAVANEEKQYRKVELNIGCEEGIYFIQTKNAGLKVNSNEINKIFNRGFSTKETCDHGYGLYNVKNIIEKYSGYFEVSMEDEYLIIKLFI